MTPPVVILRALTALAVAACSAQPPAAIECRTEGGQYPTVVCFETGDPPADPPTTPRTF